MALRDPSVDRGPSRSAALKQFFVELKRRKVYRVAVGYVVVAWVLVQVATQVFPFFEIPDRTIRLVVVALALGFPIAIILAWAYDITPSGIKRTEEESPESLTTVPLASEVATPAAQEKSIAVLPFENLSDDRENAFFADGVHDDILSKLARIGDLKVISRISVQHYPTGARNLREIAEALGVVYVLEGTVRRVSNRVRLNAQLIDARTDRYVWAETFDRELTDLFAVQSELAGRIVQALEANLSPSEKAGLLVQPTTSLEAYDLYIRARDLFHWSGSGDPHESERALQLSERALVYDPQFALAYCLVSRIHSELYGFGYDKNPARLAQSRAAAEAALRLRPGMAEAHLALAFYHYYNSRDFTATIRELTLAQRALPNDAEIVSALGMIERRRGRWEESILHFERALQLDPCDVLPFWNLAETLSYMRRYTEADRILGEAMAISPEAYLLPLARADLALRERGDPAPLHDALRRIPPGFDPGGAVTTVAIRLALMERDYEQAERRLATCPLPKFHDVGLCGFAGALDDYTVPREWYAGLIACGRADPSEAARAFGAARAVVSSDLTESPDAPKSLVMLGLIEAMLGRTEIAISLGIRATERLPVSADALDGPLLAANLAVIYAQLGETDRALDGLERIVTLPGGPTPGTLRIEPQWDSLRSDARFQKLLFA
ncbi:MAG: FlgO family outer membrane protein [Chthoniobacterales bacterium]